MFMRIFFFIFTLSFIAAFSKETSNKIFVKPENIMFEANCLLVKVNDDWQLAPALYVDEDGYFVKKVVWPLPYICAYCGHLNESFTLVCASCGRPRAEKPLK